MAEMRQLQTFTVFACRLARVAVGADGLRSGVSRTISQNLHQRLCIRVTSNNIDRGNRVFVTVHPNPKESTSRAQFIAKSGCGSAVYPFRQDRADLDRVVDASLVGRKIVGLCT
jgi:hypothetical protein